VTGPTEDNAAVKLKLELHENFPDPGSTSHANPIDVGNQQGRRWKRIASRSTHFVTKQRFRAFVGVDTLVAVTLYTTSCAPAFAPFAVGSESAAVGNADETPAARTSSAAGRTSVSNAAR
jgi:hypothetical protein